MMPEAGGNTLDIFTFFTGSGSRTTRTPGWFVGLARGCGWMQWKPEPVSATQYLSLFEGAASGS